MPETLTQTLSGAWQKLEGLWVAVICQSGDHHGI